MRDYVNLPAEEKEELVKRATDLAHHIEYDYGNCIQSVLAGLQASFPDIGITDDLIKASFGMAGGGCISLKGTCGALLGAAMAISLFYGRPIDDLPGYYDDCHALIRTVFDAFEEKYGSVLCADVLEHNLGKAYDWKIEEEFHAYNDHDGSGHDAKVAAFVTETVARMILDGKLKQDGKRPDVDNPYFVPPVYRERGLV